MCSSGWSQFGVICEVKQSGGMKWSERVWKSRVRLTLLCSINTLGVCASVSACMRHAEVAARTGGNMRVSLNLISCELKWRMSERWRERTEEGQSYWLTLRGRRKWKKTRTWRKRVSGGLGWGAVGWVVTTRVKGSVKRERRVMGAGQRVKEEASRWKTHWPLY